ncbi:DUF5335 family protein [Halalkalibaculum sp. DA3122]|uniref:DUF5335 family protein n=1 Tax=unclassified Halalkalibaculum TaxID=2964617 RepID=UPI003754E9AD
MAVKKIDKKEWMVYFDTFSKKFLKDKQPEYAEIRVMSNDIGVQQETRWSPLKGISYDPKDDILDINVERLNRMILHPKEIYVDQEEDGWVTSIEVIEADGTKDIIEIR